VEEHVFDLLPGYALDCLDPEEKEQVSVHLDTCARCRHELQTYAAVVGQLPMAVSEHQPPPGLKAKIMQEVKSAQPNAQELPGPGWWQRFTGAFRLSTPAWGLAGLVVILVLAASNLFLWQRLNKLESTGEHALITVALNGTDAAPQATGLLIISDDGAQGTMIVDGLPDLGQAQQYQLWLIQDGKRTSGGVFSVDSQGYGRLMIASPAPLNSYSAFGVTIEPAGGSPGPTGSKVLGGEL
jgi:anti-sigma-K factor RskA